MSQTSGPHWMPLDKPFVRQAETVSRLFAKAAEQALPSPSGMRKLYMRWESFPWCCTAQPTGHFSEIIWTFLTGLSYYPLMLEKNWKTCRKKKRLHSGIKAFFSKDPQSGFSVSDFTVFLRQKLKMIRMTEVPHELYWNNYFDSKHLGCIYKPLTGAWFPFLWCQYA